MTSFVIHVVSHSKHNRTARAQLPKNPRKRQYVGAEQMRVVRGRPLVVSEEFVNKNLESLRAQAAAHEIELRTPDGRRVDLQTLVAEPVAPSVPLPNVPLDSLANDKNPVYPPGWKFIPPYVPDDLSVPQVLAPGEQPALMKEAGENQPVEKEAAPEERATAPLEPAAPAAEDPELDDLVARAQAEAGDDGDAGTEKDAQDDADEKPDTEEEEQE